jgi:hypothetical protein
MDWNRYQHGEPVLYCSDRTHYDPKIKTMTRVLNGMGEPWSWFNGNVMQKTAECLFIKGECGRPSVFVLPSLFEGRVWADSKCGSHMLSSRPFGKMGIEPSVSGYRGNALSEAADAVIATNEDAEPDVRGSRLEVEGYLWE